MKPFSENGPDETGPRFGTNRSMRQSELGKYESAEEPYKDEETLRELYWDEGLSIGEVAERFGCARSTVHKYMEEYGIERRQLKRIDIPGKELRELYVEKELSIQEIADKKECGWDAIRKRLREHGIEVTGGKERVEIPEQKLRELYVERGMSANKVADEIGCSRGPVVNRLREYGIDVRGKNPVSFEVSYNGYERSRVFIDGKTKTVRVHRLAAVAWFGWDAVVGNVVHHKSGHPRDNREENLEPMANAEHTATHNRKG